MSVLFVGVSGKVQLFLIEKKIIRLILIITMVFLFGVTLYLTLVQINFIHGIAWLASYEFPLF